MSTELSEITAWDVAVDVCKAVDAIPHDDALITYSATPHHDTVTITAVSHLTSQSRQFELTVRDTAEEDVTNAHLVVDLALFAYRFGKPYILLILRGGEPSRGRWALPGGYLKNGETFEQAARREAAEETGVRALPQLRQVGVYDAPDRDPRGRVVSMVFTATLDDMSELTAGSDASDAQWVPISDLPQLWKQMAFDHAKIVRDVLRPAAA